MERATEAELSIPLEVVRQFVEAGIDFIPIPVRNEEERERLKAESLQTLRELVKEVKDDEQG